MKKYVFTKESSFTLPGAICLPYLHTKVSSEIMSSLAIVLQDFPVLISLLILIILQTSIKNPDNEYK